MGNAGQIETLVDKTVFDVLTSSIIDFPEDPQMLEKAMKTIAGIMGSTRPMQTLANDGDGAPQGTSKAAALMLEANGEEAISVAVENGTDEVSSLATRVLRDLSSH